APPAAAAPGMALVTDWIEERAGAQLDTLAGLVADQAASGRSITRLLEDLELVEGEIEPEQADDGGDDSEGEDEQTSEDDGNDSG
ncbi:hypothetical protein VJJ74_08175, partial [Parvimonas micra]|uniref:hypothetical protein n=1 Tax=Parvimonas micra TaxID=33033 RepID=UPI002B467311